jgi:glycosyltransferase involved in cell wall biosynthesis
MTPKPELSIVIPTLNEAAALPEALASIVRQRDIAMEVVIADGGSTDGTCSLAAAAALPAKIVPGRPGRCRQLNAGVAAASGEFILCLHADSILPDSMAFRMSVDFLRDAGKDRPMAGHFRISFRRSSSVPSLGFRYYERKALLDRRGCSHGDQGILIPAELLRRNGGFDESCPLLAETRFADRLRESGSWLLLPAEISSSARRFEREGLKERQTLNAVIMALAECGREDILAAIPTLYRLHGETGKLRLRETFRKITALTGALPVAERAGFWERVGHYACSNAWQVPFFGDVLLNSCYCRGDDTPLLNLYDRHLQRLCTFRPAARLAALAARCWLNCRAIMPD